MQELSQGLSVWGLFFLAGKLAADQSLRSVINWFCVVS